MPPPMQHNTNVKDPIIWKRCLFAFYWLQGTSRQKWHESNAVHTKRGMAPTGWRGPWTREGWGVSVQKRVLSFQLAASPPYLSTFSHVSSSLLAQVDSASPRQEYLWGLQLSQGSSTRISAWEGCSGCTYHPTTTRATALLKKGLRDRRTGLSCLEKSSYDLKRELLHNSLLSGRNKAML